MKKKKERHRVVEYLNTGIFPATIIFSLGFTPDELYQHLLKTSDEHWVRGLGYHLENLRPDWDEIWGVALSSSAENKKTKEIRKTYFIIINEFYFSDEAFVKLAHEIVHSCQHILPDLLNRDKEHEAEAYLHTHLMKQILTHIRK